MATYSLQDTFDLLDKDKNGTLDCSELKAVFRSAGRIVTDDELHESLLKHGIDPKNVAMDYDTFVAVFDDGKRVSRADIKKLFYAVDLDISGYLTAGELRHVMTNMNLSKANDGVVDEMLSMYDLSGNGQINFEEFVGLVENMGFTVEEDKQETQEEKTSEEAAVPEQVAPTGQTFKVEESPVDVQNTMKLFDYTGTAMVTTADLQQASELLKIEKMAGVKDPEANPSLHWTQGREKRGLGKLIYKANHIALIVSDVGRSAHFYSNVMGFQQIRRPNFDRHGAWFTMGNVELHLIKSTPLVHSGDDLIVGHISIETSNIDYVPGMLRKMNIPFRQNVSVPKGPDAGKGTNSDKSNSKIVRQYFFCDPDGYYLEVCNCDVFTKFCLGEKIDLDSYEEGAPPLSLEDACKVIGIMQKWSQTGNQAKEAREDLIPRAMETDRSSQALAALFGCTPATFADEELLAALVTRGCLFTGTLFRTKRRRA